MAVPQARIFFHQLVIHFGQLKGGLFCLGEGRSQFLGLLYLILQIANLTGLLIDEGLQLVDRGLQLGFLLLGLG